MSLTQALKLSSMQCFKNCTLTVRLRRLSLMTSALSTKIPSETSRTTSTVKLLKKLANCYLRWTWRELNVSSNVLMSLPLLKLVKRSSKYKSNSTRRLRLKLRRKDFGKKRRKKS
jgi:hypothetical protein